MLCATGRIDDIFFPPTDATFTQEIVDTLENKVDLCIAWM